MSHPGQAGEREDCMTWTEAQRVHEQLGPRPSMAGRSRPLLFVGIGAVLFLAAFAGLESGEHTLTLAIGGLFATLAGGAWMMMNNPAQPSQRSLGHTMKSPSAARETIESKADLPDPMAYDIDMPL